MYNYGCRYWGQLTFDYFSLQRIDKFIIKYLSAKQKKCTITNRLIFTHCNGSSQAKLRIYKIALHFVYDYSTRSRVDRPFCMLEEERSPEHEADDVWIERAVMIYRKIYRLITLVTAAVYSVTISSGGKVEGLKRIFEIKIFYVCHLSNGF